MSVMYAVATLVTQLGGTPAQADAVWESIKGQTPAWTAAEFIQSVMDALEQVRAS